MNEAFIWLSGLRFIDQQNYQWLEIFSEFSLKRNLYEGFGKKYNIPDVNWFIKSNEPTFLMFLSFIFQSLLYGMQPRAIQGMLDFDHSCRREEPSVVGMIYPFRSVLC